MAKVPLVDQAFLESLERLTIHWQKSFRGLVGGHNESRFAGPGQEFLDHRHFHHGDDFRAVNWRAYLRLEKLFLKMFQVEPRVPVRLLLDLSRSMAGEDGRKFDYARKLTAALCYVGLVRLDTIAIHPFRDALEERFLCSGGRHRFAPTVAFLEGLEAGGKTDFLAVARQFAGKYMQRSLLIILSDFLTDDDCLRPLQFLADFGHELLLIHLWADQDRTPPWLGELHLEDAETGAAKELDFDEAARGRYTESFDAWARDLRRLALSNGGRYAGIPTSLPIEHAVFGPLSELREMV